MCFPQRLAALTNMVQPGAPPMTSGSEEIVQGMGGAASQQQWQRSKLGPLAPGAGVSSSSMCVRHPRAQSKSMAILQLVFAKELDIGASNSSSLCISSILSV